MDGWIKLYRQLAENELWLSQPFTRGQAWVDLIMLANYSDGYIRIRGVRYEIKRGQVGWSEKNLAKRWKWSRGKVRRFLEELEKNDSQIVQQKNNVTTLLSIANYEKYQNNGTANKTPNGTTDGHQTVQQTDTNKKEKKEKKEKKYVERKYGTKGFDDFYQNEIATLTHSLTKNFLKNGLSEEDAKIQSEKIITADKDAYEKFMQWISKEAPTVNEMNEPFKMQQYLEMRQEFNDKERIRSTLEAMHNKAAYMKNTNAYLTFKAWYKNDFTKK